MPFELHTILLVDDNNTRREHLKRMLSERDNPILEADNSEQALELIHQHTPSMVITETELPTRSGLFLLQEIKKSYPDTEVILTTHNASSFSLLQALRHGAFDFIVRPIDTSEILFNVTDRAFAQIELRLQNQSLLAELEQKNLAMTQSLEMMTALSEAIEQINSAMEIGDLLSRMLDATLNALSAKRGLLALIRNNGERNFGIKISRGIPAEYNRVHQENLPEGLMLDIARSGSPLIVPSELPSYMNDRVNQHEQALIADPGLLSVPIYHKDKSIGVLILLGHPEATPFTDQNLQFLIQLAHHAAIALEKAGIIHQLKRQTQSN
jgi:CheY-like chemotaxis protein